MTKNPTEISKRKLIVLYLKKKRTTNPLEISQNTLRQPNMDGIGIDSVHPRLHYWLLKPNEAYLLAVVYILNAVHINFRKKAIRY